MQRLLATSFVFVLGFSVTQANAGKTPEMRLKEIHTLRQSTINAKTFLKTQNLKVLKDAKGNRRHLVTVLDAKKPWATLDSKLDGAEGTSTEKVYSTYAQALNASQKQRPVIVAVIDSGVDTHHEDLIGKIWVNEIEAAGVPGVDDDGNGYVDDVNGWNFLGNPNGKNVVGQTLEVTREFVRLSQKQENQGLTPEEEIYFQKVSGEYNTEKADNALYLSMYNDMKVKLESSFAILKTAGLKEETLGAVNAIDSDDALILAAKEFAISMLESFKTVAYLQEYIEHYSMAVNYYYNPNFDSTVIVKDDPSNLKEKGYGNAFVNVTGSEHGTHVSGIIAANRFNDIGIFGQALNVKIMPIRAVPDGDERDKDVANAVRYAVDNGAQIINMSFGKPYSPHKAIVDEAFAYAEKMGVLLVHAAGNSALNTEVSSNFPSKDILASADAPARRLENWIEVGASTRTRGAGLTADFSNYGKTTVDLFAPGVGILSTIPGNSYAEYDGTSMASPEVAGVAALLLSLKPELSPKELRELLMSTVTTYHGLKVSKPGSFSRVSFSDLSESGGIVNAFNAAEKMLK